MDAQQVVQIVAGGLAVLCVVIIILRRKRKKTQVKTTSRCMSEEPSINPEYAAFKLRLGRSRIHRWGIYAAENIPARRKVMEYIGERISRRETKRRSSERELHYLFTLDNYWTIDGSVGGSGAEYINHSCEPNLVSRIVKGHILYLSRRRIKKGEELTIDYNFSPDVERVPCACGSSGCRGTINLKIRQ